jgi:hypothetical protein
MHHTLKKNLETVEFPGRVVGMFGPGSKDPGFKFQSYMIALYIHVHQCSSGSSKAE